MGFGVHKYLRANMDNPDNQDFPFSTLTGQFPDVPDEEEEKEYQEFHKFLDEIFEAYEG